MPRVGRQPSHAGSWYTADAKQLAGEISTWMSKAQEDGASSQPEARAIIGPHAGYSYCGHVMAHAYRYINPSTISRVFLLGPSHHFYSARCSLSGAQSYDTPLGSLEIDQEIYSQLKATGKFDIVDLQDDEAEHSLELHTPYIASVMRGHPFKLVPIIVGALSNEGEAEYGRLLGPYLDDPATLFIISSDFCHWGKRFQYVTYLEDKGAIWQSIKWIDDLGIKAIETGEPQPFVDYLAQYKNTICGRHPIGVLLNMLQHCSSKHKVEFKFYDQSSQCKSKQDSSVSYAAAVISRVD